MRSVLTLAHLGSAVALTIIGAMKVSGPDPLDLYVGIAFGCAGLAHVLLAAVWYEIGRDE